MRYVALSRADASAPIEILGVGETIDEAYVGARAWFDNVFDKYGDLRWNELVAMQNNLNAVPEAELYDKTGVTLDEWIARLTSAGQPPGTPQPPKPPELPGSSMVTLVNSGWELHVWVIAGILIVARPLVFVCMGIWANLQGDVPIYDTGRLIEFFFTSLIWSVVGSVVGFFIFRWFKDDATLQDYLFFILILNFASITYFYMSDAARGIGLPI